MIAFKRFIGTIIDIDENEWNETDIELKKTNYKKGDLISKEGDIFKNIYFINSGIVRSYLIDNEGRDFTW